MSGAGVRLARSLRIGALGLTTACHDVTRFSSRDDHFEGDVVQGSFVRTGVAEGTRLCLTLDAARLQEAPGIFSTSDRRFASASLRPIPQLWHDPLSTLRFGEGRVQNGLYIASPSDAGPGEGDTLVVLSLLHSGDVEARLLRGAPGSAESPLFAVFPLTRKAGACSF